MNWENIGRPVDVRPLFAVERRALLSLLGGLTTDDWHRPTACPGWDVHDVAGHILHGYVRWLSGRDGHPLPAPRDGEALPDFLAHANEEFVVATRWLSGAVLVDLLAHLGPQVDAVAAERDLDATGGIDVWWIAPGAPAPNWLHVARELTEFWVHQQQIRDAVGRPGGDEPRLLGAVIDTFLRGLPHTMRSTDAPVGVSVRVTVPGTAGGRWTAVRMPTGWRLAADAGYPGGTAGPEPTEGIAGPERANRPHPDPTAPWPEPANRPHPDPTGPWPEPADRSRAGDSEVTAEVELDADTLWRLATRTISPSAARQRAGVSGVEPLADAALQLLSIIREEE